MNAARRNAFRGVRGGLLGAALLLCAVGVARAQDPEPVEPSKWAVKAGIFFPTQGTLRSQSGSPYHAVGVDYDPNFRYHLLDGRLHFGAEFLWRDSGGKTFLTVPLTAKIDWTITPPESQYRVYGGLGVGIYLINTERIGGTTQAGLKFILGVDINDRWFLEANYDYVSGFSDNLGAGLRVDGLTVYLGTRFGVR